MFDYFYGGQADLFSFYRIPKALFTDTRIRSISCESKVLYGLLLDRMSLSAKNGWMDSTGRVYIIFTVEEIMESLACGNKKAVGLLRELEEKAGLIERRRQGLGKPNLIYVKNFAEVSDGNFQKCQNDTSRGVVSTRQEMSKGHGNKTNQNKIEMSKTDPFFSGETGEGAGMESEGKDDRALYQNYFAQKLGLSSLIAANPEDEDMLREMQELLVDTVCSHRKMIRIVGDDKPFEVVKGQLMKLNGDHLRFVLMCLKENTTQVRNIRQYLLTTLYNAPMTMHSSYAARVQHDLNSCS